MTKKALQVREVARLSRVTVRTLHHYEKLGLLVPSSRSRAGYRLYNEADLLRLQQILIHRELGFPLKEIKALLDEPEFDHRAALERQRVQLEARVGELSQMIEAVDLALAALDDEDVDLKGLFEGFDPSEYDDEVEARWGDSDAYREAKNRSQGYSKDDWQVVKEEQDVLMRRMAALLHDGLAPESTRAIAVAEEHRLYIDRWFYPCSRDMHVGLAEMYVSDPRFAKTFERHAEGLAAFFAGAIRANRAREGALE